MLFKRRRETPTSETSVEVEIMDTLNDRAAAAALRENEMQRHEEDGHTVSDAEFELPDKNSAAEAEQRHRDTVSRHNTPPAKAIGISYHEGDSAPQVSAIGEGDMAQAIIDMANELGIYIHRDINLMAQLENLKEGEEVPRELFVIISTILSFSYLLQGKTPEIFRRDDGSQAVNIRA